MRVIVINPWDQSVSEAEHNGHYRGYYRLLSGPTIEGYEAAKVRCFTLVEVGDRGNHLMFVDDEGLLADVQAYFQMGDATTPFAGRGVIARGDGSEDETGATLTVDEVARDIKWLPIGTQIIPGRPVIQSFGTADDMLAAIAAMATRKAALLKTD